MNHPLKKILPVILLFTMPIVFAQHTEKAVLPINFEEAWEMMESSHSALRSLRIDQAAALRDVESLSHFVPGIGFSLNMSRSSPLISNLTNPPNQTIPETENWSLRGGLDIRLSLKPTVSIENQIKALQLNLILLEKEIKVDELKSDLRTLFYQMTAGEKKIRLQERILTLSRGRLEQVEAQYGRGLRSELELLSAKISVSRDQPALERVKIDQEKRLITLRQYLGMDADIPIKIIPLDDMEMNSQIETDDLLGSVMDNRQMKTSRLELEIAEKSRALSQRELLSPTVGISMGWSTNINPVFEEESWTKESWKDNLGLGLSLAVPLDPWFKGSKGGESIQKQNDSIEKSKIAFDNSLRKMRDSVNSLLLDLALSQANVKVHELNIELQEKTFQKVQQNYENGRSSLLDLDNSRQELQKALMSLEEEKLNINLILLELNKLTLVY